MTPLFCSLCTNHIRQACYGEVSYKQQLPLYLEMDYGPVQALQYEGHAWLDLGDHLENQAYYQRAADAFQIVEQLPDV
jgi:hypothetical protein